MITTLEIESVLYNILNVSEVTSAISGDVYITKRPENSNVEDVVINSITGDAEMIQRSVLNVNIHVPSIDNMPNHQRFKMLANLLLTILKGVWGSKYNFWVESQSLIKEPSKEQWFYNLRIRFKYHNT